MNSHYKTNKTIIMKTINKIYLVILIICGLFIVGDNNYFNEALTIGSSVIVLLFIKYNYPNLFK